MKKLLSTKLLVVNLNKSYKATMSKDAVKELLQKEVSISEHKKLDEVEYVLGLVDNKIVSVHKLNGFDLSKSKKKVTLDLIRVSNGAWNIITGEQVEVNFGRSATKYVNF